MSRWTHLQEEIRHRFGMNVEEGEKAETVNRSGADHALAQGRVGSAAPSSAPPERCWWPGCDLPAQKGTGHSFEQFSVKEMLCRTHHIDLIVGSLRTEHLLDAAFDSTVAGLE